MNCADTVVVWDFCRYTHVMKCLRTEDTLDVTLEPLTVAESEDVWGDCWKVRSVSLERVVMSFRILPPFPNPAGP